MVIFGSVVAFEIVFGAFVVAFVVLTVLTMRFVFQRNREALGRFRRSRQSKDAEDGEGEGAGSPGGAGGPGAGDGGEEPEPPVIALVLAGGGNKGAIQVGMLEVLAEHGFVPDMIFGASVGAVNGAAYAGDPTRRGAERLTEVWRGLTGEDVFPEGRLHGPWRWLRQRPAVHTNDGLRRIVEGGLVFERLEDAEVPFEVVATSLSDGQAHWFTSGPAVEAILASAAIPAILPPVEIDGEAYIDGGVVDNVPIWRAVDAGADVILVLLCGPPVYTPPPAKRPVEAMVNALFVSIHARFAVDAARLPEGVEVVLCTGDASVVRDYADFSHTEALMNVGRAEAADVLRRHWAVLGLEKPPVVHPVDDGAAASGAGEPTTSEPTTSEPGPDLVPEATVDAERHERRTPSPGEGPADLDDVPTGSVPTQPVPTQPVPTDSVPGTSVPDLLGSLDTGSAPPAGETGHGGAQPRGDAEPPGDEGGWTTRIPAPRFARTLVSRRSR
jgi:NTE family protein